MTAKLGIILQFLTPHYKHFINYSSLLNDCAASVTIHRFRKCPFTPLCIEDAERVGDPILFERPCKCIEDARSLVLRLDLAKCLAEEL